jgi:hypothetical protein
MFKQLKVFAITKEVLPQTNNISIIMISLKLF